MNRFTFDKDDTSGFLVVETKWGNIVIEQATNETVVQFVPNDYPGDHNSSHIEDNSYTTRYAKVLVISMVKDE